MNVLEAFQIQLDEAVVTNGDYLKGQTREQVISGWGQTVALDPNTFQSKSILGSRIKTLDHLIQDWKEHAGQKQVFYMIETGSTRKRTLLEMRRVWSKDINFLAEQYDFVSMENKIPKLKLKK